LTGHHFQNRQMLKQTFERRYSSHNALLIFLCGPKYKGIWNAQLCHCAENFYLLPTVQVHIINAYTLFRYRMEGYE
jgi:hypothetical protein